MNGKVTVYDTLDHQISGFSQKYSVFGCLFTLPELPASQYGAI
ncbi:hypothetical protein [Paraburkholderia elongata]|nr:hypothetical protein [Paraburkholderia elongata]